MLNNFTDLEVSLYLFFFFLVYFLTQLFIFAKDRLRLSITHKFTLSNKMAMSKILKVKSVGDYIKYIGDKVEHPLVGVVDFAKLSPIPHSLNNYDVYGIFMHEHLSVNLTYGCGKYDYQNGGTIICVAPGQIGGKEDNGERINVDGWALLFHPDLLHGTGLEKNIANYTFFDYSINEALHTTPEEYTILIELMQHIKRELQEKKDEQQDAIIVNYISLLLNYCKRFYERQFMTRKLENIDVLQRFRKILDDYYQQGEQLKKGVPSVSYCTNKLCMSPGYLGDLMRKYTNDSAISYIHQFIIQKAKNAIAAGNTITNVAYDLGFEFPGHLSRLFKKKEGISPSEYLNKIKSKTCF